jgi:hypothetical protein
MEGILLLIEIQVPFLVMGVVNVSFNQLTLHTLKKKKKKEARSYKCKEIKK